MASSTPVCGICDLRHINKPSVIWCSECDEGLCADCKEHHGLSKSSRKHPTIPITEYLRLPENILQVREYCDEHSEKFQLFCKQHDCTCCRLCAFDRHSTCEGVTPIERVVRNVKTSNTFQDTSNLITEILETINEIRRNRKDNILSVQQQRKLVENEILAVRATINKHLDKIQETLMKELTGVETTVKNETTDVLASLDTNEKQLHEYNTTMANIKQYATDLQTFLSVKGIERGVSGIDKSIHTLLTKDKMTNTSLSYQIDKVVQQFPSNIKTLGKVVVQSQPCEISISRKKHQQAQIMVVATPPRSIENITVKLEQTINTMGFVTRGCALLPDGRMVFSFYSMSYGRIISINKDGTQGFDTGRLSVPPFDIAYIEDTNTIAVTSGGDQCISIIDIGSGQIKKTFPVKSVCYGITYRNNTLIYCVPIKGLRMINLKDDSVSDVFDGEMSDSAYVATYNDKLYYTNSEKNTVTCCDLHGNIQWKFKDESILKMPRAITVDNNGNVYVVGESSNNVLVISYDGQRRRQLIEKKDGLNLPTAFYYKNSTNQLLVANKHAVAFLFKMA